MFYFGETQHNSRVKNRSSDSVMYTPHGPSPSTGCTGGRGEREQEGTTTEYSPFAVPPNSPSNSPLVLTRGSL